MAKPTVGQSVHYVDQAGACCPAVITGAAQTVYYEGIVHLALTDPNPGHPATAVRNVGQGEKLHGPHTWHRPC